MRIETTILKNLIKTEDYTKKVLPFLKSDYFSVQEDRVLFETVSNFVLKYNTQPSLDSLLVEVDNFQGITDEAVKNIKQSLNDIQSDTSTTNLEWLVENTEKFCQDRAIYLAMTESLEIMNGKSSKAKGAIPDLLSKALAVTFDPHVGHDFLEQAEERYEYYHRKEEKLPFDLDILNKATKGGVMKETLNLIMAGIHVGKSLFLCHLASCYLLQGKNVLYITLEMSDLETAKRIDANTLNISFEDLMLLPKDLYLKKVEKLRPKNQGKLIIKQYPGTTASVVHFKALLNELNLKKGFVPDVVIIDYLNICASSRLKASSATDLYSYVKSIAEEVRGLAQQERIPIWSATQLNRTGFNSSDPDMADTAESFGVPATLDLMWVMTAPEAMKKLNQRMIKQLKNRYDDLEKMERFVIGMDKGKMKIFEVEDEAQDLISSNTVSTTVKTEPKSKKFSKIKVT